MDIKLSSKLEYNPRNKVFGQGINQSTFATLHSGVNGYFEIDGLKLLQVFAVCEIWTCINNWIPSIEHP